MDRRRQLPMRQRWSISCLRALDFLAELLVDRLGRGDERVLVGLVDLHAASLSLASSSSSCLRADLVDRRLRLLGRVLEHLVHVRRQAREPLGRRDDQAGV